VSAAQPSTVDDVQGTRYLAPFVTRLGAFAIDTLIALASVVPGVLILVLSPTHRQACTISARKVTSCSVASGGWIAFAAGVIVIGFMLQVAWYCRRVSRTQSVGQRTFAVRIVDQVTVEAVGPWRVAGRQLARLPSSIVFGLGYLWMLWDPRSQTWHDMLAGTIVIKA
jgi:uncharacterized RDD family membrane protein YckC